MTQYLSNTAGPLLPVDWQHDWLGPTGYVSNEAADRLRAHLLEQEARTARATLAARERPAGVTAAHGHLDYLLWAWSDLVEYRLHGTERPWSESGSAPEAVRAAAAAQARAELLERTGLAPGQRPAPLRVDVLDIITAAVATTADLTSTLWDVIGLQHDDPDHAPPWGLAPALDARPWLRWSRLALADAHALDERTGPWAATLLAPLVARVAATLGDVVEGQVLAGLCPWCGGRDGGGVEGARTLSVRYPVLGEAGEPLVVCSGWSCEPPKLARAGRTLAGEPCWTQAAWEFLAARLEPLT